MAVLIDDTSRVLIQGITGSNGRNLARLMIAGSTNIVGGVAPQKGGQAVFDLPVFETCQQAVAETGADCSFLSVPGVAVLEASIEAIKAGIKTLTIYAENVPVRDALAICALAEKHDVTVLGPNAAGCVSPGLGSLSDADETAFKQGTVGIVSKSGGITSELAMHLEKSGLGISSIVCIGGDPVIGTRHRRVLEWFNADPQTKVVLMVGEIGGHSENEAAAYLPDMSKPVVALILGRHAPAGKTMGHAGALMGETGDSASDKIAALKDGGAIIARSIAEAAARVNEINLPPANPAKSTRKARAGPQARKEKRNGV